VTYGTKLFQERLKWLLDKILRMLQLKVLGIVILPVQVKQTWNFSKQIVRRELTLLANLLFGRGIGFFGVFDCICFIAL